MTLSCRTFVAAGKAKRPFSVAPAATPRPVVDRLHAEIARILCEPELQERIARLGMQGADMTVEQIARFQKAEVARWAAVIKTANIRLE